MAKYHHGNLRNTLIEVATELLAEEGTHALSLRKMAQRAGVSHNAPYMHFADKEAVLAGIAEEGFRLLAIEIESAIATADTSTYGRLIAASSAYIRFALDRPNHLQVMFRPYEVEKYPSLLAASQAALNCLFELVKSGQENHTLIAGNPHQMTKSIWAMVHGVAVISIAYQTNMLLPENTSIDDGVASVFVGFLLDGLATKKACS
jgi:AcrR family transcriptional regulator